MSNCKLISVLLVVAGVSYATASTLRPVDHGNRDGYDFCLEGRTNKKLLKNMCVKAAQKAGITKYDPSIWENLSCKSESLSLDPGTGGPWETKHEELITCVFKQGRTQADQQKKSVYGRGLTKFDVFKYTWDQRRKAYIAEGNYANFLEGIIPGQTAPKIDVGSAHASTLVPANQASSSRDPYDKGGLGSSALFNPDSLSTIQSGGSSQRSSGSAKSQHSGGTMSSGSLKYGGR